MHKIWNCLVDIMAAIIIMFLAVFIYFAFQTETIMKTIVSQGAEELLTKVKSTGMITLKDYEALLSRLDITNSLYDITLEHEYSLLEPEYRMKSPEEILADYESDYMGENIYHYREVITKKPEVYDPIHTGNMNTETNESILEKAVNTPANSSHIHTEDCYEGHKHSGSKLFTHVHQHTLVCIEYMKEVYVTYRCMDCGKEGGALIGAWYWDSSRGTSVFQPGVPANKCYSCNSTRITDIIEYRSYGYSCGYDIDINGDGREDAVGRNQAYAYQKSFPEKQAEGINKTYTSGCYTYHQRGIPENRYWSQASGTYFYTDGDLRALLTHGFKPYCEIPSEINIGLIDDWGDRVAIRIKPRIVNGEIIDFTVGPSTGLSWYENFPNVDLDTFRSFYLSSNRRSNLYLFLKGHVVYGTIYPPDEIYLESIHGVINLCTEAIHNSWYITCGLEEDTDSSCDQIIKTLTATHDTQMIYTNDPLITTAEATFLDGSTRIVVCETTFSTEDIAANQKVKLIYTYIIGMNTFTMECEITVSIIQRNITCSRNHQYNLNNDGSDPGCPYCRAWVKNLRIIYPAAVNLIIPIRTTLEDNGVQILVTYYDGNTEVIMNGYEDNLDSFYLGTKPVTIGYKGVNIIVMVTTIRTRVTCDICGHEYELYPDGSNPGCPGCKSKIPIFTGNVMSYTKVNTTEDILAAVQSKGNYHMMRGDIFYISIQSKLSSMPAKLYRRVFPLLTERQLKLERHSRIRVK